MPDNIVPQIISDCLWCASLIYLPQVVNPLTRIYAGYFDNCVNLFMCKMLYIHSCSPDFKMCFLFQPHVEF